MPTTTTTTTPRKTTTTTTTAPPPKPTTTTTTQDTTDYYVSIGDIYFSGPLDILQIFLENNQGDYIIKDVSVVSNSTNAKVDVTRYDNYVQVICWDSTDVKLNITVKSRKNGITKTLTTTVVA